MKTYDDPALEEQIGQWRAYLQRRQGIDGPDVEELEGHLREELAALFAKGLSAEEAFLVGVKRMGNLDALSREFARVHSERLWKQLVMAPDTAAEPAKSGNTEAFVALGLAVAAALAIQVPKLFGHRMSSDEDVPLFFLRNGSLFVFPMMALYFLWKRGASAAGSVWLVLPFVAGAVFANVYPFRAGGDTAALTTLHLPIALWLAVGCAYAGGRWIGSAGRMDFVRFSGEWLIYFVLMALGGFVFILFTITMFKSIDLNAEWLVGGWLLPSGVMGAMVVGAWLVEAKQSVIENMAPVLTRLFTPLFTVLLVGFLGTMAWTGSAISLKREVLIGFDLLLVLVVALVLYAASARDSAASPGFFDGMQLLLVVSALAADGVALTAIGARISEFGFTPNRVAALGENLLLFLNLAWTAWLYWKFIRRQGTFAALERWQIAYLPVFAGWAAVVVVVFPPLFGYR